MPNADAVWAIKVVHEQLICLCMGNELPERLIDQHGTARDVVLDKQLGEPDC